MEQRYPAVLEVLNDGASVTDVARRFGVSRHTVHVWLRRNATEGLAGLVDGSTKPLSCPHQMSPEVEAMVVELRRQHPGWGPRSIGHQLAREGVDPVPGRTSIYRCLVRHRLISPEARKRKRSDYKRWERSSRWEADVLGFAVPPELVSADGDLRLITTTTSFATDSDVTLAELQLEAFLPADERTAEVLRRRWG